MSNPVENARVRLELVREEQQRNELRREALASEIKDLENAWDSNEIEIRYIETFLEVAKRFADPAAPPVNPAPAANERKTMFFFPRAQAEPKPVEKVKNPPRSDVAEAVAAYIEGKGAPEPVDGLLNWLSLIGYEIHGKDPRAVLNTMLWREKPRFVRLPSGYWLRQKDYPPENYWPDIGLPEEGPDQLEDDGTD